MNDIEISEELFSYCVLCLLTVAVKKEESEEVQKEVEMALFALSKCYYFGKLDKELFLSEIKEIIHHHQEHHNLTRLAYQSAWELLIHTLFREKIYEQVIVNELHFVKEAKREMEELTKCVNWKREKEEEDGRGERKEEVVLLGWLNSLEFFFRFCELRNGGYVGLFRSIVQISGAAKDNYREIREKCIYLLGRAAENGFVEVDELLKGGAIDAVLEEISQQSLNCWAYSCPEFFMNLSKRLQEETKDEMEEAKRKELKRKIYDKMEEEGFDDFIIKLEHFMFVERFSLYYPGEKWERDIILL
ncbi:uncharacterized protein MONOS_10926 [Monocercomonoides exilis]|uniref:uncharacterized protein n=1 Tax=Monocercomonoides exilis TaxID=2049356 RepID=UPI003559980D|nr:hypothetical protein MONOS_10926 [Monocercomonoides exilis]|eukprot:MONOS_10926.1-p1 / transcript=MONOS_10926.1 / gene=MONOS_10926 / organism=Monocercomonoides_exilis_PA203 / gene_product=unspecified product / transcript_product=unspecified product / location=Mono_scaffold00519:27281-28243(+) / protein_length=303 / sequence_SO=supercontig / SO=protein_coding / is_pseudo=false